MNNIVAVTVRPQGSAAPCIKRIRAFYPDLPIGELSAGLKAGRPAFSFDLEHYDVVEELEGIDRKKLFRQLLEPFAKQQNLWLTKLPAGFLEGLLQGEKEYWEGADEGSL